MPGDRPSSAKPLILIALNEINFDVARAYVDLLDLRNFRRAFANGIRRTTAEDTYDQLEPWIQWVSVHSGLAASQHGVFRLGDIVGTEVPQLFEQLEAKGLVVGGISPMNAENRLRRPAYFVPDPWTNTPADRSFWSQPLASAVAQAVNDNAQRRFTFATIATLLLGLLRFARIRNYGKYFRLALQSRGAPWRKALFLDLFLHDLHFQLFSTKRPDFSTVFFNAGAHIQHHYFFNAKAGVKPAVKNPAWYVSADADPVGEMLQLYDAILGEYFDTGVDLIVATGLTQKPYDRVKFYYRLKNHADFLRRLGLRFSNVHPRMTRDFLVSFASPADADHAQRVLADLRAGPDSLPIFGDIENRGDTLFATLTYPGEISAGLRVRGVNLPEFELAPHVGFVAIKNGMHDSSGFVFYEGEVAKHALPERSHVKELYGVVMRHFGLAQESAPANAQAGSITNERRAHASNA